MIVTDEIKANDFSKTFLIETIFTLINNILPLD